MYSTWRFRHHPCDPCACRGASYLRQRGSTHWFEHDSIRQRFGARLDDVQNLLALDNRIVVGINDLDFYAQTLGGGFGISSLLYLVIIVVRGQRNQEPELLHRGHGAKIIHAHSFIDTVTEVTGFPVPVAVNRVRAMKVTATS